MHGYEVRRELEGRRLERWANVSYGSIYGRLGRLADEGSIEVVRTEREAKRPARTVYQLTRAGRDELVQAMQTALREPTFAAMPVDLALSFCVTSAARFGEQQVRPLLEERLAGLDDIHDELHRSLLEPVSEQPGVRALVEDLLDHSRRRIEAEREWTEHVLRRLSAGDYHTPESGPIDLEDATPSTDKTRQR